MDAQRKLINGAKYGNSEIVKEAMSEGALLDQHEIGGRAAIHHAASAGHHLTLADILQAGADPNLKSFLPHDDGGRGLHLAGESGHCEVVRTLVTNGADTDATDNKGRTAVHWAALRGQLDTLRTLKEVGCNLRAKVQGRANALHFAVASGDLELVKFLVEEGVSKEQKDKNNKLPSDVAKLKGYKEIHNYLKDKTSHLATSSPSGTLTRRKDEYRNRDPQVMELQNKLATLELEKSQAEDLVRELREQMKMVNVEDEMVNWPQDIHQQMQILSHQNRDYKKQLVRANEEVYELKQQLEERRDQHEYEHEQDTSDVHQHLQILIHQNKEYRKKLNEHETKETELVKQAATDRQAIQELREEAEILKQELKQCHDTIGRWEQHSVVEKDAGARVAELSEEVQHLTYLLNEAGKTALITQEIQQKKVAEVKVGEEAMQKEVEELKYKLKQAEDTIFTLQNGARERNEIRSEEIIAGLREELKTSNTQLQRHQQLQQQLQLQIQQQHQLQQLQQKEQHNYHQQEGPSQDIQLQKLVQQLREEAAASHQTITALRHQLDTAKRNSPHQQQQQQSITPQMLQDKRRLQELMARDENNREIINQLNAKIMEMTERLKQYEKAVYGYKIRLGERERELRQSEKNKQTVGDLREEVSKLTERLAMMRQKAASARNSLITEDE